MEPADSGAPGAVSVIRSPTVRCAACAASVSNATSPGPGARPAVSAAAPAGRVSAAAEKGRPVSGGWVPEPSVRAVAGETSSGKVKSAAAPATPGSAAIRWASAASTRAGSGRGVEVVDASLPCSTEIRTLWSAATSTGVLA